MTNELMLLGVATLILLAFQTDIGKICSAFLLMMCWGLEFYPMYWQDSLIRVQIEAPLALLSQCSQGALPRTDAFLALRCIGL